MTVKSLRDGAGAQSRSPLAEPAPGRHRSGLTGPNYNRGSAYNGQHMAKHLDLEEQEQLDELKHFWNQYGNLITWVLIAVFGAFAAWNGWQYWQRTQAVQASALYDEVERAAQAGDTARVEQAFADMKDKYGGTTYAQQAGLLAARCWSKRASPTRAKAALAWVAEQAFGRGLPGRRPAAAGRAAGRNQGLRRGAQAAGRRLPQGVRGAGGRPPRRHLQPAGQEGRGQGRIHQGLAGLRDRAADYRRLVEVKLTALGVDPKAWRRRRAAASGAKP